MATSKSKRISAKIRHLIKEGKSRDQAIAIAYNMEREGRLGPRGGYKRKKRKK
jgi:hypothetical protein